MNVEPRRAGDASRGADEGRPNMPFHRTLATIPLCQSAAARVAAAREGRRSAWSRDQMRAPRAIVLLFSVAACAPQLNRHVGPCRSLAGFHKLSEIEPTDERTRRLVV